MELAELQRLAQLRGSVTLHHGTDLASAVDIEQNGLSAQRAQALAGSGDLWATDDVVEAEWFAKVNPANGPAARLEFELPAHILIQLLGARPALARLHRNDGFEFFAASFAVLNANMTNKRVLSVP
jgi:hypothetical protein